MTSNEKSLPASRSFSARKITYAGALLALSVILPQVIHFTGIPDAGKVLLPMHIPVLLAGFLLGPVYGLIIGGLAPLLSFLVSGMPAAARLPFMIVELAVYGLVAGLLYLTFGLVRVRFGTVITLIGAMLAGRAFYGIALIVAASLFGIQAGGPEAVIAATVSGVIGIAIQLLVIPPIIYALKKGGQLDAIHGRRFTPAPVADKVDPT